MRNNANEKTPKINQGLTQTLIAKAPATALKIKFIEIKIISILGIFFRPKLYNCERIKKINIVKKKETGKSKDNPKPIIPQEKINNKI